MGVFVGHNHKIDFSVKYHNIGLHLGRITGFSGISYIININRSLKRGCRIINLNNNNYETYIKNVDGDNEFIFNYTDNNIITNKINIIRITFIVFIISIIIISIYLYKQSSNKKYIKISEDYSSDIEV